MSKKALVTGASSGIGKAICEMLIESGWEVYGIGRNFEGTASERANLHQIELDLLSPSLENIIFPILSDNKFELLVNNAGVGFYGLHEELNPKMIRTMVRTNLEVPMILTNLMLRDLKAHSGRIINISSVTATESNPHGVAYGATKAGLRSFGMSLFDEARKYGLKVTTIMPDMTDTNLYRNADFTVDDDYMAYLEPDEVADTVRYVLECPPNQVLTEVTLKPQYKRIKRKS